CAREGVVVLESGPLLAEYFGFW
nr:immunoglobulin heavy chain junction region [Macaca mulatta]MOW98783.1 immunoglobulin heavy chain junction region [Macaca mulatta]MOX01291.1 immunoglobulin heavy chain junction region [Macaca mulatta]MOX03131.1 immunoglobulin heavy chain junction region [Macaca mulatta]MOX06328.1 immunoglobulin heavy chain junction region [Macaca mulatta]